MKTDRRLIPHEVRTRHNLHVCGNGQRPMLFAHGFGCDQNMWRFVAPAFEDDFRLILFDYVGSGGSDLKAYSESRYATLDAYADDVLNICRALDLRETIFVGHSVSSVIGMLAAIREPHRFSSLILIGPSPRYINESPDYAGGFERGDIEGLLDMMDKNYIGWASFLAPAVMKNPERPELTGELERSFCSTDPRVARQFARVTFLSDNRQDVAKVPTPCLILQCSEDVIAPLEVGEYLHRTLPESTLRVMKATGHCPHMSHPDETVDLVWEFLRERGLTTRGRRVDG